MTPQQNTAPPSCRACGHVILVTLTRGQTIDRLLRLAALVASAEREACARLVERNAAACRTHSELHDILSANALAIRARGDA